MRLVVFSDLHLDTAFAWAPPRVARRRRQALRDTLVRIVELADEVDADAILCGGDLYEHDRFTPDTVAFVRDTLNGAGRRVFVAPGNHDWFGPGSLYVQAQWSDDVHLFTDAQLTSVALTEGVTLWGAAHRAPANTSGFFERGFAVEGEGVHLALFHGSERGGLPYQGGGKRPHAPFDVEQVETAGLDHAFVGHFHTSRKHPRLTYPGNPEPLTFGEEGARGAVVADVRPDGTVERTWHPVSQSEVHDVVVDLTGCGHFTDVRTSVEERLAPLSGCVRLTVEGDLPPDVELSLDALTEVAPHLDHVVARRGRLHVAYDLDEIAREQTVRGQFVQDVLNTDELGDEERERIIVTGLRALEGREDLEVA